MNQALVFVQNGQAFTTSKTIADGVGIQHQNVLALCRQYQADFEAFGIFTFKTWKLKDGRGRPETVAYLNEQQATLLVTYCRNTEKVRAFKIALVRAFFEARQSLQCAAQLTLTYEQRRVMRGLIGKTAKDCNDWRAAYKRLKDHFGTKSTTDIPAARFPEVVRLLGGDPAEYPQALTSAPAVLPATGDLFDVAPADVVKQFKEVYDLLPGSLEEIGERAQELADTCKVLAVLYKGLPDTLSDKLGIARL